MGITYKKDINDYRESPCVEIFFKLKKKHFVDYYDPMVKKINLSNETFNSVKNLKKLKLYDAVIIGTDHSNLNYNLILKNSKKIFDTRGVLSQKKSDKIISC